MKKIIAAIMMAIVALAPVTMKAQRGMKSVGVFGGFNSELETGLAGVYFQYGCNKWLRLSPNMQMLFKKHDMSAFHINGNAHFVLPLDKAINIYGITGITYQSWRHAKIKIDDDGRLKDRVSTRFGVGLGAGIEAYCTKSLKVMLVVKHNFVDDYSSTDFFAGIGYVF